MSLLLSELFDRLVELLVLLLALLLLELGNLLLLLEEACLDLSHLFVSLKHLGQEVVGALDGNLGLNADLHSFHGVVPSDVVESYFSLDVVVDLKLLGGLSDNSRVGMGDSHVLREGDLALLPNQLL